MKAYIVKVKNREGALLESMALENGFVCNCQSDNIRYFHFEVERKIFHMWNLSKDDAITKDDMYIRLNFKKDFEQIHKLLTKKSPKESIKIGDHKVEIKKKAKYGLGAVKIGCETLDKQFIKRLYELTAHDEFGEFIEKLPKIAKKLGIPKNAEPCCGGVSGLYTINGSS